MKHNKHVIETNTLLGYVDQQVKKSSLDYLRFFILIVCFIHEGYFIRNRTFEFLNQLLNRDICDKIKTLE
jgi:hypothetical protein